jgi:hypothetical protein
MLRQLSDAERHAWLLCGQVLDRRGDAAQSIYALRDELFLAQRFFQVFIDAGFISG